MQLSDSLFVPQPDESLGQYIRRLRQQQGLSQKAVVGLAGIHFCGTSYQAPSSSKSEG